MGELSNPTIAALVKAGQNLRGSDLKTMIQAADLWDYSPYKEGIAEENRAEFIRSRLLRARAKAKDGDASAHRAMLAFANPAHPANRQEPRIRTSVVQRVARRPAR